MASQDTSALRSRYMELINGLATVIRSLQMYDSSNVAVRNALDRFLALLNETLSLGGDVHLRLAGEFIFVNDIRLRYVLESMLNFDFLVRELKKREVGEIIFHARLTETQGLDFVKAFLECAASPSPFETFRDRVAPSRIRVNRQKLLADEKLDRRQFVRRSYYDAVSFTKGVMSKVKGGEQINLRKAKRVVEFLVDQLVAEPSLLLGMTAIKDYDEYTYYHSVNVSILSIALGQKLGLSRRTLEQIGVASLFHDMGKVAIPEEILNKPSSFTNDEWQIIKQHPRLGFITILRLKGFEEIALKSALVAFSHHLNHNRSGYPSLSIKLPIDLISEIVTIADKYDAMTSSRVYARVPISPDRALSLLQEQAGMQVNPVLVKVFVNLVGVFPQGSLVLLDTKEMGLVFESNPNPDMLARPRVLLVMDSRGNRIPAAEAITVDLMEQDAAGRYRRSIVRSLDPNEFGISLSDFLM